MSWKNERERHSMASRGIKTSTIINKHKHDKMYWPGKIIEITKDGLYALLNTDARSAELFKGQKLQIISLENGGWLHAKLINQTKFKRNPGIQSSEFEYEYNKPYGQITTNKNLLFGISLNFDDDKIKLIEE